MKKISMASLLFIAATNVYAEWKPFEKVDPMTDKVSKSAITIHPSREIALSFSRRSSGEIWGTIMSTKEKLILISAELAPLMRIDKLPATPVAPYNYEKVQETIGKMIYHWNPTSVSFLFWHGKASDGVSDKMMNLANAETLNIRIFESTGGSRDYSFDMINAKTTLCQSLALTEEYCQ